MKLALKIEGQVHSVVKFGEVDPVRKGVRFEKARPFRFSFSTVGVADRNHCRRVVCAVLRCRWFFNKKTTKAKKYIYSFYFVNSYFMNALRLFARPLKLYRVFRVKISQRHEASRLGKPYKPLPL